MACMVAAMAKWKREVLVMILFLLISTTIAKEVTKAKGVRHRKRHSATVAQATINGTSSNSSEAYCLSWRMAVEANNMRGWRTIPTQCWRHVQGYMVGGQYYRDISLIIDQIYAYLDGVTPLGDALDAWIFDVDDTCLSNLFYYRAKRFGCDPYNPTEFKTWASKGESPAIPAVLDLFNKLIEVGFKVILLTGRDEETLGEATVDNLLNQGFVGYERLIMRSPEYRGQSAVMYKSEIRRQIMELGYRIWGNVGDQWSDLQGNFSGDRTFKFPNPMYFVP
uniref:Acid phosphatase 1 n=3 Tax=Chenopodium quinoa TaxID=63459 RepID=A0A803L3K3_CHEQI